MPNNALFLLIALLLCAQPTQNTHADFSAPVVADQQMVVSAHALASRIGNDILNQGGNAIDAAVATAYALAVVHPCCGNLGGGGFMTIHLAAENRDLTINFREKAPLAAYRDMYLGPDGKVRHDWLMDSYLSVGVPGTVMGLEYALQHYGSMPRARLMAAAIALAANGFVLTGHDTKLLAYGSDTFRRYPNTGRIFLNHDHPWKPGERLLQSDLAASLSQIAEQGPAAFYQGPIAAAIVAASNRHGGLLSQQDFDAYSVSEQLPIRCNYRGYEVLSMPPPSSGGVTLCLMLKVLEGYPLATMGFNSAATVHVLVETMRRAYVSRNRLLADPAFVDNPIGPLLSDGYAARLRAGIDPTRASTLAKVEQDASLPAAASSNAPLGPAESTETTQLSVLDRDGNAVSLTYTINGYFGNGRIAGNTGFLLNNEMGDFTAKPGVANSFGLVQGSRNAVEPGKQPLSSMSPTLVKKDGQVFLVLGSPGGSRIITTVLEAIINIIDFNMNLAEAINAPRIHNQWLPDRVFIEPRAFTADTATLLQNMGYSLKTLPPWGALEGIMRVPPEPPMDHSPSQTQADSVQGSYRQPGRLYGSNDARRPQGLALGR